MREIRIVQLTPEEHKTLIKEAVKESVREELLNILPAEINRILSTPESDRLITRAEAMELLSIKSRSTILTMEKSGDLEPIRMAGNRVSYNLKSIHNLIAKRQSA